MGDKSPHTKRSPMPGSCIPPLRRGRTLLAPPEKPLNPSLQWVDIDTLGQALHFSYPMLNPETVTPGELVKLITSLRYFGDTLHPPNSLYVDMIREAWLDAAVADITVAVKES